jgi:hypothetical protein
VRLWGAAYSRDELISSHGFDYLLTDLLGELASPTGGKVGIIETGAAHTTSSRLIETPSQSN